MKYSEIQADTNKEIALASLTNLIPLIDGNFLIEDSGIYVNNLKGFPGPYSSFVFQKIGWEGIISLLESTNKRGARFVSTIGLYYDNEVYTFQGICLGKIALKGSGKNGFGFDPIFIPEGNEKTFGEMSTHTKNQVSHRAKSTDQFIKFLKNQLK